MFHFLADSAKYLLPDKHRNLAHVCAMAREAVSVAQRTSMSPILLFVEGDSRPVGDPLDPDLLFAWRVYVSTYARAKLCGTDDFFEYWTAMLLGSCRYDDFDMARVAIRKLLPLRYKLHERYMLREMRTILVRACPRDRLRASLTSWSNTYLGRSASRDISYFNFTRGSRVWHLVTESRDLFGSEDARDVQDVILESALDANNCDIVRELIARDEARGLLGLCAERLVCRFTWSDEMIRLRGAYCREHADAGDMGYRNYMSYYSRDHFITSREQIASHCYDDACAISEIADAVRLEIPVDECRAILNQDGPDGIYCRLFAILDYIVDYHVMRTGERGPCRDDLFDELRKICANACVRDARMLCIDRYNRDRCAVARQSCRLLQFAVRHMSDCPEVAKLIIARADDWSRVVRELRLLQLSMERAMQYLATTRRGKPLNEVSRITSRDWLSNVDDLFGPWATGHQLVVGLATRILNPHSPGTGQSTRDQKQIAQIFARAFIKPRAPKPHARSQSLQEPFAPCCSRLANLDEYEFYTASHFRITWSGVIPVLLELFERHDATAQQYINTILYDLELITFGMVHDYICERKIPSPDVFRSHHFDDHNLAVVNNVFAGCNYGPVNKLVFGIVFGCEEIVRDVLSDASHEDRRASSKRMQGKYVASLAYYFGRDNITNLVQREWTLTNMDQMYTLVEFVSDHFSGGSRIYSRPLVANIIASLSGADVFYALQFMKCGCLRDLLETDSDALIRNVARIIADYGVPTVRNIREYSARYHLVLQHLIVARILRERESRSAQRASQPHQ